MFQNKGDRHQNGKLEPPFKLEEGMKCSMLTRGLFAAAALMFFAVPLAQGQDKSIRIYQEQDRYTIVEGGKIIARYKDDDTGESSRYYYHNDLLLRVVYSDGRFEFYKYDKDGNLINIETGTDTTEGAGKTVTQRPVYAKGELVALVSSTGKTLAMMPGQRGDKTAYIKSSKDKKTRAAERTSPQLRKKSLNYLLVAIQGWETRPADWECTKTPEGEDVCIGRGERPPGDGGGEDGGGGGGGGGVYHPDPPIDTPPDDGGDTGGGGGPDVPPPVAIPPNLPTRESCYAAAAATWEIVKNQFCPMVRNQTLCLQRNYKMLQIERQKCELEYPAG